MKEFRPIERTAIVNGIEIPVELTITTDGKLSIYTCDNETIVNIHHNVNYVWKINKTSISTCNLEKLYNLFSESHNGTSNAYVNVTVSKFAFGLKDSNESALSRAAFYNSLSDAEFLALFDNATAAGKREIIADHFCTDHTGKMSGIVSYSTSVLDNPYCSARRCNCDNAICKYCFAADQIELYKAMQPKLHRATILATSRRWSIDIIPVLDKWPMIRLEAFGDIQNTTQVHNYFAIAAANKHAKVALWTKNPNIIATAISDGANKPDNLNIGLSSLYVNRVANVDKWDFIDFVFTVYDSDYIDKNHIIINCGGRCCYTCRRCYTKPVSDYQMLINEKLK